jgi:hypothetical protein
MLCLCWIQDLSLACARLVDSQIPCPLVWRCNWCVLLHFSRSIHCGKGRDPELVCAEVFKSNLRYSLGSVLFVRLSILK